MTDNEETRDPAEADEKKEQPLQNDARVETDSVSKTECPECGCEINVEGLASFSEIECPECSARITVPAKLGPFFLVKMLGAGGMGAVYIAKDAALGRNVAVKVMLKSLGEDKEFIEAFRREARAAAKINHPNICQIYSFGTEKGQPYIVMELISGERFDALVDSGKKLDQGLVMQVAHDIAQGLAAACDKDMLHGDIKPENILLDEKLTAKLVDFGIASVAGQTAEGIWGTPYYIAPEKIMRQEPDGRSDMYSLGATIYHALAGCPPFDGETPIDVVKKRLDSPPKPISSIRPDLKPEVVAVIERMLQRERSMRHPTYSSLVSDLGKCVQVCGGRKNSLAKLRKTGRVMITKTSRSKSSTSAGLSGDPNRKSMPRIKVPRKSIVMPAAGTSSTNSSTGQTSAGGRSGPKKSTSKAPLVIFLILVLLAAIGGGGYYLYDKRQKTLQARRELFAYNKSVKEMGGELTAISNAYSSVSKIVKDVSDYPSSASNAVKTVLGVEFIYPQQEAKPKPPESSDKKSDKKSKAGKASDKKKPEVSVDEMGREAPAGMGSSGKRDTKKAEPEAAEEPDAPENIQLADTPEQVPEITRLARKVIDDCLLLKDKLAEAGDKKSAAVNAFEEARASKSRTAAAEKLTEISEISKHFAEIKDSVKTIAGRARTNAEKIEEMRLKSVEAEKKRLEAETAAEKARLAAEEAARKEAEKAALIEAETTQVAAVEEQAYDLLRINDFKGALSLLEAEAKSLTTEEGKAAIAMPIARAELLIEMKDFLAKQLTKDPYAWGWIVDRRPVDIVKATTDKITTRTREASWTEVSVRQMLHFFKKYLSKRSVPLKTLGRMNLAAAVFCTLHEGGEAAAENYSDMAEIHDPNIFKLRKQVLPPEDDGF